MQHFLIRRGLYVVLMPVLVSYGPDKPLYVRHLIWFIGVVRGPMPHATYL